LPVVLRNQSRDSGLHGESINIHKRQEKKILCNTQIYKIHQNTNL
jgi:hypothetical protein